MRATLFLPVPLLLLAALPTLSARGAIPATRPGGHQDLSWYPAPDGSKRPVRMPEEWAMRRRAILQGMEQAMGGVPERARRPVPLDVQVVEEARVGDLRRRLIRYRTEPGAAPVSAYLFLPPAKPGTKLPAVLCLHQTTAIGKREPAGLGGRPTLGYALELAQRGYVTLAPDYPSFGDSAGHDFDPAKTGWLSGSRKAVFDNARALDLLSAMEEVDADRLAAAGHSLGGHNALFTAAFDERVKVTVTSCGFTRFARYYGGNLKGWTSACYMPRIARVYNNDPERVPFDFPEVLAAIAPRAVFISAPERDDNFDVTGVRESVEWAMPAYRLLGSPDAMRAIHPDGAHDFPDAARRQAWTFLDARLRHTPSAR